MAIYHLHAKIISRKNNSHQDINSASDNQKGRSSTGAAAYRAGEKIVDERTKLIFDYSRKKGVIHAELILPQNSEWNPTRSELWNMVEFKNKREDSQVAREFEVALPVELTAEQRRELARSFAQKIANKYEIAADVCLHEPKEGENYHAHILTTTNKIEGNGLGKKVRELDMIANARGSGKEKGKNEIDYLRERWEELTNDALARAGRDGIRIDCRTLAAQGIEREPTQHEGVAVTAMERKGIRTDIREENERRKRGQEELRTVDEIISAKEAEAIELKKDIVELRAEEKWVSLEIELKRISDEATVRWEAELNARKLEREKVEEAEKIAEQKKRDAEAAAEREKEIAKQIANPYVIFNCAVAGGEVGWVVAEPAFSFSRGKRLLSSNFTPISDIKKDETRYLDNRASKIAFVDRNDHIRVVRDDEDSLLAAMQLAKDKWGTIKIEGKKEVLDRCLLLADDYGIKLQLPMDYLKENSRDSWQVSELKKKILTGSQGITKKVEEKSQEQPWKSENPSKPELPKEPKKPEKIEQAEQVKKPDEAHEMYLRARKILSDEADLLRKNINEWRKNHKKLSDGVWEVKKNIESIDEREPTGLTGLFTHGTWEAERSAAVAEYDRMQKELKKLGGFPCPGAYRDDEPQRDYWITSVEASQRHPREEQIVADYEKAHPMPGEGKPPTPGLNLERKTITRKRDDDRGR